MKARMRGGDEGRKTRDKGKRGNMGTGSGIYCRQREIEREGDRADCCAAVVSLSLQSADDWSGCSSWEDFLLVLLFWRVTVDARHLQQLPFFLLKTKVDVMLKFSTTHCSRCARCVKECVVTLSCGADHLQRSGLVLFFFKWMMYFSS